MTVICMAGITVLADSPAMWIFIFLTGGIAPNTYTLGLALLGRQFEAKALIGANAAFLAAYGIGWIVGPVAIGGAMERLGPSALPVALAIASAAVVVCVTKTGYNIMHVGSRC